MRDDHVHTLLGRLAAGDTEAAAGLFRAYAPYLRVIVRRHLSLPLRAKFDSIDVVQAVWADLVKGFREAPWRFDDPGRFRAFLVTMTRNRFLDWVRHHRQALEHERRLPWDEFDDEATAPGPRPSEVARADELWERMLALCPPGHQPVLRMKRQGLALEEIAARSGLHKSSVRRVLYELARRLATQDDRAAAPEGGWGHRP
jgi:RNA polymerase sigma-70 factor (ECF subfamily)